MNHPFIVVAYYTEGTLYEQESLRLRDSLYRFSIPHRIQPVLNLGDWNKNTSFKPDFVLSMLERYSGINVAYVDADAEFKRFPKLFWTLPDQMKTDIAVYVFDRGEYTKSPKGTEVLSGTVFFKNTLTARDVVVRWKDRTQSHLSEWDQKSLEISLAGQYDLLPPEYCKIFDRMAFVKDPVIVHYQASRRVRRNHGDLS